MAAAATPGPDAEDPALAQAFARRETWAFERAYRRYGSLLFSVALNVLHNAEEAEDCVHNVLARVWKNAQPFAAGRGSVRGFLVVCVRNDAISRRRAQNRRERLTEKLGSAPEETDELDVVDFVEQARVREALAQLPEDQRKPLALAYFGGKTHVQIAAVLNEPLGTVKSRIALALRKLGAALSKDAPP